MASRLIDQAARDAERDFAVSAGFDLDSDKFDDAKLEAQPFFVEPRAKATKISSDVTVQKPVIEPVVAFSTLSTASGLIPFKSKADILCLEVKDAQTASFFLRNFCNAATFHYTDRDVLRVVLKGQDQDKDKFSHQRTADITGENLPNREAIYILTARRIWEDWAEVKYDDRFEIYNQPVKPQNQRNVLKAVVGADSILANEKTDIRTRADIMRLEPKNSESAGYFLRHFCRAITFHRSECDEFRAVLKGTNLLEDKFKYSVGAEITVDNLDERESKYIACALNIWKIWAETEDDKL